MILIKIFFKESARIYLNACEEKTSSNEGENGKIDVHHGTNIQL